MDTADFVNSLISAFRDVGVDMSAKADLDPQTGVVPLSQLPPQATGDFVATSQIGAANGVAPLNNNAIVPSENLPATALTIDIPMSMKGAFSGVAELDSNGKVPSDQLPTASADAIPSITQYGAVVNGIADDRAAWNLAVADINAGIIKGVICPGLSAVSGSINTITAPCSIMGIGDANSGIVHTGGGDVTLMTVDVNVVYYHFAVNNFSFFTKQSNQGQALVIRRSHTTGDQGHPAATCKISMTNVQVRGLNDAGSSQAYGWNRGIELKNCSDMNFENVNFYGPVNFALSYPDNSVISQWAWYVWADATHWSVNNRWHNCDVYGTATGWKCRGPGSLQGMTWVTCCPVFLGTAWDCAVGATGGGPYWAWINCQAEFFNNGLVLEYSAWINVQGCQFYNDGYYNVWRWSVYIRNCQGVMVNDNYHTGSADNGSSAGIGFEAVTDGMTSRNSINWVTGTGTGIYWTGNCQNCWSVNDMVTSVGASAYAYYNNSSSPLTCHRQGMKIRGGGPYDGLDRNSTQNWSGQTITATQVVVCQLAMPLQIGDFLRVTIACQLNRISQDCAISANVREYNHRPASAQPVASLTFCHSVRNYYDSRYVQSTLPWATFYATFEFEVIARLPDGLITLEFAAGAGASVSLAQSELRIERV